MYKIIKLQASNFRNLKAVTITPDGNIVTLTGDNGAGKSAVLDAMQAVIAGKDGAVERPIRDGANNAEVIVDLGHGLVAKRRYTPSGSTLKIEQADGTAQRQTPQALMDTLCNAVAFDPLSFMGMKPKEQRDLLLKLVGVDPAAIDAEAKGVFDGRTALNREADKVSNQLAGCPAHDPSVPAEEVSTAVLMGELTVAQEKNRQHDEVVGKSTEANTAYVTAQRAVTEAQENIAKWQQELQRRITDANRANDAAIEARNAAAMVTSVDVVPIQRQIADSDRVNRIVRDNKKRAELKAELDRLTKAAGNASARLTELEQSKQKLIRDAKMPIEGLSFDDAGVLYQGKPLSVASTGHKLRVSAAIGMALNPKLRVLFVRDGSLLDTEGLKVLAEMAAKNDFQIWIEDARSTDPTAIVIDDGEVVTEPVKV
jgi:ABC-type cobalamin/Fe3+-siderophores transport system ATPase subunit